jgi:pyrroline-5-carboxylate reductase
MNALLGKKQIAVIGAGNIGRILLERLSLNGMPNAKMLVCDADEVRAGKASRRFGARACSLTDEALLLSDIFLLTAPPKATLQILKTLTLNLRQGQIVVSFAAAVSMSRLEAIVPSDVSVARVMPNAPSKVGKGMNPVAYGSNVTTKERKLIESLLQNLGWAIEVRDDQMNWCVGLTGAAMRSLLPALEGMTQAGIEAGFAEVDAHRMAAQVMFGTAALVLERDLFFDEIKSLTPMETVDEVAMQQLFADAARATKGKMDRLQQKLEEGSP